MKREGLNQALTRENRWMDAMEVTRIKEFMMPIETVTCCGLRRDPLYDFCRILYPYGWIWATTGKKWA